MNSGPIASVGGSSSKRASGASARWGVVVALIVAAAERLGRNQLGNVDSAAIASEPWTAGLRLASRCSVAYGRVTYNNALERTVGHGGPRLAAASASWPAAQLGR